MRLGALSDVYAAAGPVATVVLETSRDSATGAHEVELRWRALREQLAGAGAPDAVLEAAEALALEVQREGGAASRVLVVGAEGDVRLDETVPARLDDTATWGELPALMPFLVHRAREVSAVVVLTDRTGADIRVRAPRSALDGKEVTLDSGRYPIHKTGIGGWAALRYEHSTENAWDQSAKDVAQQVDELVALTGAELVAVGGDVRAVQLLEEHLGQRAGAALRHLEHATRGAELDDQRFEESLQALLQDSGASRDSEVLHRFVELRERHDRATEGLAAVVEALRQAQVDTLVLTEESRDEHLAVFGPAPTDLALEAGELTALGEQDLRRAPVLDVLLRAAAGTDARLLVTDEARLALGGAPAALLRWA
ncbi:Vms1/Ankzf1 family peptidyl-tRNA hydrolase [Vallicoccus soli]|uniref:Peptide chain release factor 2 n=1 Tax=Vallicoccus soli TaxID=2339232 RepID=A0A3A3YT03_9ACTN|nr:Vms1/Ankzf1 family peptidyl-tRNA hydrolase [Vallicoccus soli]RJK93808.1 hypothetical protein D5H78_15930 [Vallicoccus soli]